MSKAIPVLLDRLVRKRALNTCEYCRLPQEMQEATFHVDHIIPKIKDGETILQNLALACVSCSLHKAARIRGIDPLNGRSVSLFNPRKQRWKDHFRFKQNWTISGRTSIGRATIETLRMNRPLIVEIRRELAAIGKLSPIQQDFRK